MSGNEPGVQAPQDAGDTSGGRGSADRLDAPRGASSVPSRGRAAVAGLVAVVAGAGIGELAAAIFASAASPFGSIGGVAVDLAPAWAKELAISLFYTNDKNALLVGIALVLLAVGAAAGFVERRVPYAGRAIVGALGLVGIAAAWTRENAPELFWAPSLIAGAVGFVALGLLLPRRAAGSGEGPSRRAFVIGSAAAAAAGLVGAAVASGIRSGARAVQAVRDAVSLPAATTTADVPAGAELGIDGLAPVVTPNSDFYRIDTALVVPEIDPASWSLRIHGLVENEVTITWDELLALPLEESAVTLSCVSNQVGGDLVGNAVWLGYPIRELLRRAVPSADADMVLSRSHDGFTAGTPIEALTDDRDAILAVAMNGEPLPLEHGFPVRMVVPGLYGYVSATKWVTELEVTRFDADRAYWTDRGWDERGPIKLQSRIDVPHSRDVDAGEQVIAGVAWQPHTGVAGVEVQVDDGPWRPAALASAISQDTWVQWSLPWDARPGDHVIRCRATSAAGERQTSELAAPAPNGASGWHTIEVSVG
ncbi:molybdopterin-dependent oxidoreductase [Microbacterium halophytorum]|uniref:molybdopterin-dependent oxidoreductase n=1 Tax=Microbacterium halophytorum TaxID=2067568 RepID=UPI000CFD94BE|nr:molybdopterin-dependent oxidoreductase [Microbacterium halophytorum]